MFLKTLGKQLKEILLFKKKQPHLEIDSKKDLGAYGELFVVRYLVKQGFIVLAKNYRQRCGEIDIIAAKKNLILFVEVKLRSNRYFNNSEVIVPSKIKKIIKTAKYYIAEHNLQDKIFRFDVAIIEKIDGVFELNYIENAFAESDYYE